MVGLIKSGLSAAVAFALVVTVTLTARATENAVTTGPEKAPAVEHVEANTLALTLVKLSESKVRGTLVALQGGNLWFAVNITATPATTPSNQRVVASPTGTTPSGSCSPDNDGQICAVRLNTSTVSNPTAYNALIARIGTANPPTIQEFLNTGASYTTGGPEYAHEEL